MAESELERTFDFYWTALGGGALDMLVKLFPPRKWEYDRVDRQAKVIVECEGQGGRHQTFMGFENDAEKYNKAVAEGYALFRVTSKMLRDDPAGVLTPIMETIERNRRERDDNAG